MISIQFKNRLLTLFVAFIVGVIVFFVGLGSTGLVDETPPLFAAAGRAMSDSGDWLTPKVNGIFRFDKPPLIYWLMGIFYSLPNNGVWDSLGTISARLPSAIASLLLMLTITDTVFTWPQKGYIEFFTPLVASLGFALSPLILVWSRASVSDALLCGTLGISLLLFWRRMASDRKGECIIPWFFLGISILSKGPVAFILATLTISSFLLTQKNSYDLLSKINIKKGILITVLLSLPWYILVLIKEGKPFWDSFFGYHNFQRYTSVVNNHSEPFWFFINIMIIGSLPFTPFLFHGLFESLKDLIIRFKEEVNTSQSLYIFSLCWLASVFIFFSISATKLPSYWLPATPAAAILMSNSFIKLKNKKFSNVLIFNLLILFSLSGAFFFSSTWLNTIKDPELPNLASDLLSSGVILKARLLFLILFFCTFSLFILKKRNILLYIQVLFLIVQAVLMPSIRELGDISRQLPIRNLSKQIINVREGGEALAMIGIRKPSLHFYTKQIVLYEGEDKTGLINLTERLTFERRSNFYDKPNYDYKSLLVVIDEYSSQKDHWSSINHQKLGKYGIYNLWRIKKNDLNNYASYLTNQGFKASWEKRKVENF